MLPEIVFEIDLNGILTYRRLLEIRPKQKTIIVSGFSESDRVHSAQALGAGACVKKPYVLETLGLVVKNELNRVVLSWEGRELSKWTQT